MPRTLIAIALLVLWSSVMFAAGWGWRGDRSDAAKAEVASLQHAKAMQAERAARERQAVQTGAMASLGVRHEQDRERAAEVEAEVVAGLRAGSLRLRNDLAACHTGRLSDATASARERDAGAQLRAEVAAALVRIGRDADDQLRSCQAVIALDRR